MTHESKKVLGIIIDNITSLINSLKFCSHQSERFSITFVFFIDWFN